MGSYEMGRGANKSVFWLRMNFVTLESVDE
jgi:hypothetical protein